MQFNQVLLTAIMATSALAIPFVGGERSLAHARFHKRAPEAVWVTDWETVVFTEYVTVYGDVVATTTGSTTSSIAKAVTTTTSSKHVRTKKTTSASPSSSTETSTSSSDVPTVQVPVQRQFSQPASEPTTSPSSQSPPAVQTPAAPAPATTQATTPAAAPVVDVAPSVAPSPQAPTSAPVAPVVVQAAAAVAAPSTAAQSSASTSSSTGSGASFVGDITFYSVGMGSCGVQNTDDEMVVALAKPAMTASYYGVNPNANPLCGQKIVIQGDNGPVSAKIMDTCPGCSGHDLDLSPAVFKAVAPHGDGRVSNVKWSYAS